MVDKHNIPDVAWLLALMMTPGIGMVTVNRLALALHEANVPFHAVVGHSPSVLRKGLPVGLEWAIDAIASCEISIVDRAEYLHGRITKTGGQWLSQAATEYPQSLVEAMGYNAPPVLSVYGNMRLLGGDLISIIGSRDPSEHGRTLAAEISVWASEADRVVVSGGANGIDMAAHKSALDSGGTTCVMIPQGALSYVGPGWLNDFIESGNAVVVSQFIPDAEWSAAGAMGRNRTIAALGRLVYIVDPGERSGSASTAGFSLDYGRRTLVYAYDKVNSAYRNLVGRGAYPILNEDSDWDASYIENHWKCSGHELRKQTELF